MHISYLAAALALATVPAFAATRDAYQTNGTCDGWPRAQIEMAPGMCAGIVVAPPATFNARTLKFPRTMLQLGLRDWLVSDMYGWDTRRGAVYRLHTEHGAAQLKPLLTGLSMPHTIARGPDGKIYFGEMNRVSRFDPAAADPAATVQPVVSNLPANDLHNDRHPLSNFIFDANGDLLVNVGAPTDQCAASAKLAQCAESEGTNPTAGVRRYTYQGNGVWNPAYAMFAHGLRNSMALVRHASGTILQGENSIDFSDPHSPYEEINVLHTGAHYGWPYCFDMAKVTPVWAGAHIDCRTKYTAPTRLMPPHAAPLSMLYYDGAMFPALRGQLIMTWHGYKPTGARIVAFAVDDKGVPVLTARARYPEYNPNHAVTWRPYPGPASEPTILTPGWDRVPGSRPMGTPVGLAVAQDGAIWVTEDKNATILRIAADRP